MSSVPQAVATLSGDSTTSRSGTEGAGVVVVSVPRSILPLDAFDHDKNMPFIPPLNFAMVAKGVYRSGYPNKRNHPFLSKLGLKSIL